MEGVRGSVKFFDKAKGFGFITRDDGQADVFMHVTDLRKGGILEVTPDDRLMFDVEPGERGPRAQNIQRA